MKINLMICVLINMVLCVSGTAHGEELNFGKNAPSYLTTDDIAVTRVRISIKGFYIGGFADYCMAAVRNYEPEYRVKRMGREGFTELVCFNYVRTKNADKIEGATPADWEQEVDLSRSPLYIPAKTSIMCNSLGSLRSDRAADSMLGTCSIEYERYKKGSPRYRIVRLPYLDQTFDSQHPLVPSYFSAWDSEHPLHIISAIIYQGNNYHNSSMETCLTRVGKDKGIKGKYCFPPSDEKSPGQIGVEWTIPSTEMVGIACTYPEGDRQSSGDCAVYLVVEIPSDLILSPENAFRDYGNVPAGMARRWCEDAARIFETETIQHPSLCDGEASCSFEDKVRNCESAFDEEVFPRASCVKDGSCWGGRMKEPEEVDEERPKE